LAGWLVGGCFVPAWALGAGVLSGGRRLFEVLYILAWYVGPMNRVAELDYTGLAEGAMAAGTPVRIAVMTLGLMILAAVFRARRLHSR